jgi:hypothetical protein
MPRASDITKTLNTDAVSPLDFILKNVQSETTTVPNPAPSIAAPADAPTPKPAEPVSGNTAPAAAVSGADPMPTFGEKQEAKTQEAPLAEEDEIDQISEDPIKENYLKLRTKAKEATKTVKELAAQKAEIEERLKKYETGEIVPEILQEKENKIAELSKYEKLHNLKASDEYREKFVEPLNRNIDKLKRIFTDYGVAPEELDAAINHTLSIDNKAQLNAFLSENFPDALGAAEVRDIILDTKTVQQQAKEAEQEPTRVYEQLQQESQMLKQAREQQRMDKITETAKESWVESLLDIRTEGKITELIRKENDPVFNQKFVDPILQHSATEYGRLVTELAKNGLTEMTKDLAKGLAHMVLRATAQGLAFEARDVALQQLEEVQSSATRVNQLFRPQVGGGVPSSRPAPQPAQAMTPKMAAEELVNNILLKRN